MASGPYQSNVFRFVISQYRQGLDRHRQAIRGARSTAALGVALPVYAVVSICQLTVSKLRQFKRTGRLFGTPAETAKLFDFSGFESLSDAPLDIEASVKTQAVYPATCAAAEQWLAQMFRMVGTCLDLRQVKILRAEQTTAGGLSDGQITGIASDLETRSLVLVQRHTIIWNGLNAAQQARIQTHMERGILARPSRSFWVEVLKVMMWLQQRYRPAHKRALPSGLGLPEASLYLGAVPSRTAKVVRLSQRASVKAIKAGGDPLPVSSARSSIRAIAKNEDVGDLPYLETDAITTGYVEHPLEKLLKWIDQLLVWAEKQYRSLRLWLSQ